MTINAYTFDRSQMTAYEASNFQNELMYNKNVVLKGMECQWDGEEGFSFRINKGLAVIYGRFVELIEPEMTYLPIGSIKDGDCMAIRIDLGKNNESSGTPGTSSYHPVIHQVWTEKVNESDLNHQNLLELPNSGKFDLVLGKFEGASTDANPRPKFENQNNDPVWRFIPKHQDNAGAWYEAVIEGYSDVELKNNKLTAHEVDGGTVTATQQLRSTHGNFVINNEESARDNDPIMELRTQFNDDDNSVSIQAENVESLFLDVATFELPVAEDGKANFKGVSSGALKLMQSRSITLNGDIVGSAMFDGSQNITIEANQAPRTVYKDNYHAVMGVDKEQWFNGGIELDEKGRVSAIHTVGMKVEDQTVGVKKDIAALQTRTTTIESKNTEQDTKITAITNDVTGLKTRVSDLEAGGGGTGGGGTSLKDYKVATRELEYKSVLADNPFPGSARVIGLEYKSTSNVITFLPQTIEIKVSESIAQGTESGGFHLTNTVAKSYVVNGKTYEFDFVANPSDNIEASNVIIFDGKLAKLQAGFTVGQSAIQVGIMYDNTPNADITVTGKLTIPLSNQKAIVENK